MMDYKHINHCRRYLRSHMERPWPHMIIGTLVLINAITLGIETYTLQYHQWFYTIDKIILTIFGFEVCLKIFAFGNRYWRHPWYVFNVLLVVSCVVGHLYEYSPLSALRILVLLFVFDAIPAMRKTMTGFKNSLRGVIDACLILLMFFYLFSLLGTIIFQHPNLPQFSHIGQSMMTMFQVLSGDDWSNIFHQVQKYYETAWIFFFGFYVLMVFIVLNLFIGVIVNALQKIEDNAENSDLFKQLKEVENELARLRQSLVNKDENLGC